MWKKFLTVASILGILNVLLVGCSKTEVEEVIIPTTTEVREDVVEEIIDVADVEDNLEVEETEDITSTTTPDEIDKEEILETEVSVTNNTNNTNNDDKEIKVEISVPETQEIIEVESIVGLVNNDDEDTIENTQENADILVEVLDEEPVTNVEVLDAYLNIDSNVDGYSLNYNLTGNIDIESHIFDQVNELRQSLGVAPLTSNNILVGAALTRSKELTELFSHTRPNGTEWSTIFNEIPYNFRACGENLTTGTGFTRQQAYNKIFESWYNSPGHYANMLNPDFKEIGIAVYFEPDGTYYATQMFGAQSY